MSKTATEVEFKELKVASIICLYTHNKLTPGLSRRNDPRQYGEYSSHLWNSSWKNLREDQNIQHFKTTTQIFKD